MNIVKLSIASLRAQPLAVLLTLMLLALGVATVTSLLLLGSQLEQRMSRDTRGIDLVVGAKGSPLQLVLSAVYQSDIPTGNIPLREAERVARHPLVAQAIPLALGDAVGGMRIVGTTHDYVAHYDARMADGQLWRAPLEAVLGSVAAARTGLRPGDSFIGSHGLGARGGGHLHDEHPYRVVGMLAPTGSVIDRLVLTSVATVWQVHEDQKGVSDSGEQEVTALLLKFRSPLAALTLPRMINAQSPLQAASPAFETARLLAVVGVGVDVFRTFAALLVLMAGLGVFLALYATLRERAAELAVLRALGASRARVFWYVALQGLMLGMVGGVIGLVGGHVVAEGAGMWLRQSQQVLFTGSVVHAGELVILAAAVTVGLVAALLPAWQACRVEPSRVLSGN